MRRLKQRQDRSVEHIVGNSTCKVAGLEYLRLVVFSCASITSVEERICEVNCTSANSIWIVWAMKHRFCLPYIAVSHWWYTVYSWIKQLHCLSDTWERRHCCAPVHCLFQLFLVLLLWKCLICWRCKANRLLMTTKLLKTTKGTRCHCSANDSIKHQVYQLDHSDTLISCV